jgi:ribonuclease HIII
VDSFSAQVKKFVSQLGSHGIKITDEKPINYGMQLKVSDGANAGTVNIYNGKKGTTFVVQSKEAFLKDMLQSIVDGSPYPPKSADKKTLLQPIETANQNRPYGFERFTDFDGKWIGIDESGKGDFFGPLAIAAVMVDENSAIRLENLGVKDSKKISDKKTSQMAAQIREICRERYAEFKLRPEEYNKIYCQYEMQGKNLNHLLGYTHAKVLEELLQKEPCKFALADKFGNEKFTENQLLAKGKEIVFVQIERGEQNIAVAAASVLARDAFLETMEKMREEFGVIFPKGAVSVLNAANSFVAKHGKSSLPLVCKTHFRTYNQIL